MTLAPIPARPCEPGRSSETARSPKATFAVEGDDVVVVLHGLEIHQQRLAAVETQGCGGQQSSLEAVSFALSQRALRRPRCVPVLVWQGVEEALDLRRCLERAQGAHVLRQQAEGFAAVLNGLLSGLLCV